MFFGQIQNVADDCESDEISRREQMNVYGWSVFSCGRHIMEGAVDVGKHETIFPIEQRKRKNPECQPAAYRHQKIAELKADQKFQAENWQAIGEISRILF